MQAQPQIDLEIVDGLAWLLSKPKRIKIAVGGRASTKSTGVGDIMLMLCDMGKRVCCGREFQNSIDDSVHENLKLEIERLGLESKYSVKANSIEGLRGGQIIYKGLARNITSIKSLAGVDYFWIEEGESVSEGSLRILTPSVRSSAKSNVAYLEDHQGELPEIWVTMNRGSSKDAIAKKYLSRAEADLKKHGRYEDDLIMVVELNWRDNPWFPPEMAQEREDDYNNLPRAEYDHIWEGAYSDTVENAIIRPEWFDACVDAHIKLGFQAIGQERASYDPADCGDDKAVARMHGAVVTHCYSTDQGRIDTATDWALTHTIDWRPDAFTWDGDGAGMGLKRQITDALDGKKIEVEAFRGGEGPDSPDAVYQPNADDVRKQKTNKEMFANKRAQYYWLLRDRMLRTYQAVEANSRVFDPDELISFSSDIEDIGALRAELCRIPRKMTGTTGRIQLMSKPEMLKMGIDSPNRGDAVMMLQRPIEVVEEHEEINFEGWSG